MNLPNSDSLKQTQNLQNIASNPNNSSWVFASAGSGKTKILTDRVLRLLLDGVSPAKILCITFTKVGAKEMQERINQNLLDWLLANDEILAQKITELTGKKANDFLQKKARSLLIKILDDEFKIKIQTIHSFCQNIIKIFPFEIGIKANFEVIESNKEKLLLIQAQNQIFQKSTQNSHLRNIIEIIYQSLNEEQASELIAKLLGNKEKLLALKDNFFDSNNLRKFILEKFSLNEDDNEDVIFNDFINKINCQKLSQFSLALKNSKLKTSEKYATQIDNFLANKKLENFTNFKLGFFNQKNEPRKLSKKILENPENLAIFESHISLISNFEEKLNSLKITNDSILLFDFIDAILAEYDAIKKQNSYLDYNDLIVKTNQLLQNPEFADWVKMKMDSSFDHILVDESQDTNHEQWNIIKALSEDFFSGFSASQNQRSIFIVGDEKQSIYSFQGADPNISQEIYAFFKERLGENLKKIELTNSFRSNQTILDGVDEIFKDESRQNAISKINQFKAHKAIRNGQGKIEIWPQIKNPKKEKNDSFDWQFKFEKEEEEKDSEILAKYIALNIRQKIDQKYKISASQKEVSYQDFMILLRKYTSDFEYFLRRYFNQYNIPFTSAGKIKFSENILIQDLISLLKFTLLKSDDLNLACLLKSPFFEISEEKLLEICLKKEAENKSIYQILDQEIKNKLDGFIKLSQKLNLFEFYNFVIFEQKYQEKFIANFGEKAADILDKFLLFILDFSNNFSNHPQKFLEFIAKIDPEISPSSGQENAVKISTIHSAKGLQAPIVIIPDCAYNFNQLPSSKENILWPKLDENSNLEIPLYCAKKSNLNKILQLHQQEKIALLQDEYLRLFYVALTRAEDELYIGGFGNSKDPNSWYEIAQNALSNNVISEEEFFANFEKLQKNIKPEKPIKNAQKEIKISSKKSYYQLPNNNENKPISTAQIKGKLTHKILEIFGINHQQDKNWLLNIANKIIENEILLDEINKNDLRNLAKNFLFSSKFNEIFSGKINCEIEISSPNKQSYRIDLLVEKENEILIIDYKSDENIPQKIPEKYIEQLLNYQNLVKEIYPNKEIKLAILWTKNMTIAEII